jgi:replicative DNA helicase
VNAEADWQTEFSKHKNRADLIIAKNRNGPIGSVKAFCDVAVNAFRDIQNEEKI